MARPVVWVVALVVLAPIGAACIVTVLLLLGIHPQVVFAPGLVVKSWLEAFGFHVAKRVAIMSTVTLWWVVIVVVGFALERRSRRRAA